MRKNQEVPFNVILKNDPDKDSLNLINQYWVFNNGEFENKPKQLSAENNITAHKLSLIIKEHSVVHLECNCGVCSKIIKESIRSQTHFIATLRDLPLCQECVIKRELKVEEQNRKLIEIRHQQQELARQKNERKITFSSAIERYKEMSFSDEQARFMIHFMETCPNRISLSYYSENYVAFYKFQLIELIHIEENLADKYIVISYPEELNELLKDHLAPKKHSDEIKSYNTWSRLSFLLEKNRYYRNSNTPRFSGTITFKEDVVIEKGTKCLYGLWDRDHDNAWLSLTPLSDIIVSENKPLHKEPEHIQDILTRFLNNPDNL